MDGEIEQGRKREKRLSSFCAPCNAVDSACPAISWRNRLLPPSISTSGKASLPTNGYRQAGRALTGPPSLGRGQPKPALCVCGMRLASRLLARRAFYKRVLPSWPRCSRRWPWRGRPKRTLCLGAGLAPNGSGEAWHAWRIFARPSRAALDPTVWRGLLLVRLGLGKGRLGGSAFRNMCHQPTDKRTPLGEE